jgi:hypothetical protein
MFSASPTSHSDVSFAMFQRDVLPDRPPFGEVGCADSSVISGVFANVLRRTMVGTRLAI